MSFMVQKKTKCEAYKTLSYLKITQCSPLLKSDNLYFCRSMKVYNNLSELPEFQNAVITIGSFDGVHKGHQKIIEKLRQLAKSIKGESVVITFHPHPRIVLQPNNNKLKLLNTIEEKVSLLEKYGVDNVVVVPFTKAFSEMNPDSYIQEFLLDKFSPKYIVIGYDHKFGKERKGDIDRIRSYQKEHEFEVIQIEKQELQNIAISSTKIRNALAESRLKDATTLMGHYFKLTGTVKKGQQIGRTLGYPTANIELTTPYKLVPVDGVYATHVFHNDKTYGAMLYIGDRPTIDQNLEKVIEVNIFEFDQNIYGDKIQLELIDFVRGEMKFNSRAELSQQLALDKVATNKILTRLIAKKKGPEHIEVGASVTTIILNFNGEKLLDQFLPFAIDTSYPNHEVVVADNHSTDNSLELLEKQYADTITVRLPENYGFAEGYNKAISKLQSESEYLVLLNSDVEVTPNWLDPIIELMESDKSIGACQPKIRAQKNKTHFEYAGASGGWIDYYGFPFCRGRIFDTVEKDVGQYDTPQEIFWASGAAFVVRRKLYESLDGFDAMHFAHMEEIDLCWRIKRAGYKIMVVPESVVYHIGGSTLNYGDSKKTFLNFRNNLFMMSKNLPDDQRSKMIRKRLFIDGLAGIQYLMKFQFANIAAIVKAHWAYFGSLGKLKKKRKHYDELIQKMSIANEMNQSGRYHKSIIWQYYFKKNKLFKDLEQ